MRFSQAFIPTTKEAPSDAVLASHIFLTRAGFTSQVAAGLYNYLPLGKRVLKKIENVINDEMNRIGGDGGEGILKMLEDSGRPWLKLQQILYLHDYLNPLESAAPATGDEAAA